MKNAENGCVEYSYYIIALAGRTHKASSIPTQGRMKEIKMPMRKRCKSSEMMHDRITITTDTEHMEEINKKKDGNEK